MTSLPPSFSQVAVFGELVPRRRHAMGGTALRHPGSRIDVRRAAFTLVELLVVLVVLAVLAAIVLPKFVNSSGRAKEARAESDLRIVRGAIERFHNDTGAYPAALNDLVRSAAPAQGKDSSGNVASIAGSDWHGPYLQSLPKDPISGGNYKYDITPGNVGRVSRGASATPPSGGF